MASHCGVCMSMNVIFFLTRCALLCYLVCSSEEALSNSRRRVIVVLLAGLYFLQVTAQLRGLRNAQQR